MPLGDDLHFKVCADPVICYSFYTPTSDALFSNDFEDLLQWVHRKCSGIKGSMYEVMKTFVCRGCVNPVTSTGSTSVDIGVIANLELVDKFFIQAIC